MVCDRLLAGSEQRFYRTILEKADGNHRIIIIDGRKSNYNNNNNGISNGSGKNSPLNVKRYIRYKNVQHMASEATQNDTIHRYGQNRKFVVIVVVLLSMFKVYKSHLIMRIDAVIRLYE